MSAIAQTLLERDTDISDFAVAMRSGDISGTGYILDHRGPARHGEELIAFAHESVPFVWTPQVFGVAEGYALPPRPLGPVVARLPHASMWWHMPEGNWFIHRVVDGGVNLFWKERDGWLSLFFTETDAYPDGSSVKEERERHWRDVQLRLLRLLAFVNSPFVSTDRASLRNRGAVKRWHGRRIGDPQPLMVVRLRSAIRKAVRVEAGHGPRFHQRWLVRGHYRAQWYPTVHGHRIIWIAPHLKGPEDAPLKAPTYAVVR